MTKSRKNEALIRNDGVYVISGIFCRANACKKVKARRAEVASTRSAQARNTAQAKRRAVRNVKMHSRPDRWPQIVRFASGRADSLANRRFVNDLCPPVPFQNGRAVWYGHCGCVDGWNWMATSPLLADMVRGFPVSFGLEARLLSPFLMAHSMEYSS